MYINKDILVQGLVNKSSVDHAELTESFRGKPIFIGKGEEPYGFSELSGILPYKGMDGRVYPERVYLTADPRKGERVATPMEIAMVLATSSDPHMATYWLTYEEGDVE